MASGVFPTREAYIIYKNVFKICAINCDILMICFTVLRLILAIVVTVCDL